MGSVAFAILFIVLFLFSIYIGFLTGQGICERQVVTARDYLVWNTAGVVVAVLLSAVLSALPLLYAVLFGLLVGYIAGMRMTFGEALGPWRAVERFLKRDPGAARASSDGRTEARRRRRDGECGRDLISVAGDTAAHGSAGPDHRASSDSSEKDTR